MSDTDGRTISIRNIHDTLYTFPKTGGLKHGEHDTTALMCCILRHNSAVNIELHQREELHFVIVSYFCLCKGSFMLLYNAIVLSISFVTESGLVCAIKTSTLSEEEQLPDCHFTSVREKHYP